MTRTRHSRFIEYNTIRLTITEFNRRKCDSSCNHSPKYKGKVKEHSLRTFSFYMNEITKKDFEKLKSKLKNTIP